MSINKAIFTGNLGAAPELRYTTSGKAVASFNLAVSDNYDREKTYWLPIIVWGKMAESCANYLDKGSKVGVDARVQTRNYENKSGQKIYVTEFVADRVEFLDSKGSRESKPKDDSASWDSLGKEVSLDDVELVDKAEDPDSIPF